MEPRIRHWHCRYRLVGEREEARLAVERLERAVRPRVSEAYAEALARVFENDPAVYVLRRVNARLVLDHATRETESRLAEKWADRLGHAVVSSIARGGEDSGNLVRFADEPDYVAHFIADLLGDTAWERWYYGAFSHLRLSPKKEAILSLLFEGREQLAGLLRRLESLGCLKQVLALLDRPSALALWSDTAKATDSASNAKEFRLFVSTAIRLLDLLGVWKTGAPSESAILEEYLKSHPLPPGWTDHRSLAQAVLNVISHLISRNYLSGLHSEVAAKFSNLREQISSEFDWLDFEWLEAALFAILTVSEPDPSEPALPFRSPGSTPLHRRILERIRDLLRTGAVRLEVKGVNGMDGIDGASLEQNALRLYAGLAIADAEVADRAVARAIINHLLMCASFIAEASDPQAILTAMRTGQTTRSYETLAGVAGDAIRNALCYGPLASEALEEILRSSEAVTARTYKSTVRTECAGLFLAARAILDTRIPQLAAREGAGPLSSVLLALGIVWMGSRALKDAMTDPGLAFWCGLAPQEYSARELLAELDEAGCERLLAQVRELFEARASLSSSLARGEAPSPQSCLAQIKAELPDGAIDKRFDCARGDLRHKALGAVVAGSLKFERALPAR